LLAAYAVRRVVSSPATRCADTVRPYAASTGTSLRLKDGLSEEGYAVDPSRAPRHLLRLLERGAPAALCSHGPVLPDLLGTLESLVHPDEPDATSVATMLAAAAADTMVKGEVLVAHLVGTGQAARVVAVERHLP
jgi:8-oxo-dGTP diphosphatase